MHGHGIKIDMSQIVYTACGIGRISYFIPYAKNDIEAITH